jgi:dipeptidyl aminopeptidase/acylaminoacyl peptidase
MLTLKFRHLVALILIVFSVSLAASPIISAMPANPQNPASLAVAYQAPTATPNPHFDLTVQGLMSRGYGGGAIEIKQTLARAGAFTRQLIAYPSDGLTIYGFMNVPAGKGPFPVIIAIHGYINPGVYETIDYTARYADTLARAGYLVLHPNLRNYRPSDNGPNLFRVGYAVDVLNLIALVKQQAGQPGPLQLANGNAIGLWGHSMGGGISIRTITISPDVRAVVLYGSMSGDETKNLNRFGRRSNATRPRPETTVPADMWHLISPVFYYHQIQAAVSIHHGDQDDSVPLQWSLDLCGQLRVLKKNVECFIYTGQPHTFRGQGDQLFIQRMTTFFNAHLK